MSAVSERRLHRLGTHRVLEPAGAMPQAAWRLDNTPVALDNEILCDVETLNIDSASFKQIADACERDAERIAAHILGIVNERGKQHNPVTGSGGMFIGSIAEIGEALRGKVDLEPGDRIASLVSLSLTPLHIETIRTRRRRDRPRLDPRQSHSLPKRRLGEAAARHRRKRGAGGARRRRERRRR